MIVMLPLFRIRQETLPGAPRAIYPLRDMGGIVERSSRTMLEQWVPAVKLLSFMKSVHRFSQAVFFFTSVRAFIYLGINLGPFQEVDHPK